VKPADLTENSVLLGSTQQMIDTLKKVEAAGFDEVILYFNVGMKPHPQVKTRWPVHGRGGASLFQRPRSAAFNRVTA